MSAGESPGAGRPEERLPARAEPGAASELRAALDPLRELAAAFAAGNENLRAIAEGQLRIAKRLERADRSEAIVQSTQALNETFRGVQRTQERLISRIEGGKSRPWLFLLGGIAAVAAVAGGLLWFLLGWVGEREERAGGEGVEVLSRELARRDENVEELRDKLLARSEELLRQANLTAEQKDLVEELRSEIASLTERNAELGKNKQEFSEALKENARLTVEAASAARKASETASELAREQDRNRELSRQVDELIRKLAERPAREPPSASVAGRPVVPPGPAAPAAEVVRDPVALGRLTEALNGLLGAGRGGRTYRFVSIGGTQGKVLRDVVLVDLEADGREAKRIVGAEAHLVLDAAVRRVEVRLKDGHIVYYGVQAPFWGGQYVVPVVNVDVEAWRASGLAVLEEAK